MKALWSLLLLLVTIVPASAQDCPTDAALASGESLVSGTTGWAQHFGFPHGAAAASDQTQALVWTDWDQATTSYSIRVTVVRDGVVQNKAGTYVASGANNSRPDIEWDGTQYVVTWLAGDPGAPSLWIARLDRDGNLLDKRPIPLPRGGVTTRAALATNAFATVIVIDFDHRLYLYRLSSSFSLEREVPVAGGIGQGDHDVASSSSGFLVVWNDFLSDGGWSVGATLVPDAGSTGSEHVLDLGNPPFQPNPSVAWSGGEFVVAWNGDAAIDGAFVRSDGSLRKTFSVPAKLPIDSPAILATPARTTIFWLDHEDSGNPRYTHAAEVEADGSIDDSGVLGPTQNLTTPKIARSGDTVTLFWVMDESLASTVNAAGAISEFSASAQTAIFRGAAQWSPEAVQTNSSELAVWMELPADRYDMYAPSRGARVWVRRLDGPCIATQIETTADGQLAPRLVTNGEMSLLYYQEVTYGWKTATYQPRAKLIDNLGNVIADVQVITSNRGYADFDIGWTGSSFFIWENGVGQPSVLRLVDPRSGAITQTLSLNTSGVAAMGSGRLVVAIPVWEGTQRRLFLQAFDPVSGAPLTAPKPVSSGAMAYGERLAWSDGAFALAYVMHGATDDFISITLFNPDLNEIGQRVEYRSPYPSEVKVAPSKSGFIVSWREATRVYAVSTDRSAHILEGPSIVADVDGIGGGGVIERSDGSYRLVYPRIAEWNDFGRIERLVTRIVERLGRGRSIRR